ncbi:MAG TPA: efflux RND transporter permease subunit [Kofleriaceae bacterium]|nr:efflux RND transporter permease subunit [Kofleriaceae bacterium]
MFISNYAIKKPIITTVVMVALVVFGLIALVRLHTDEFPEVTAPVVNVAIVYPGASPGVVERELINPLEESFRSISGVDTINSTAVDGYANILVQFVFEKDIQQATQDIRDKISESRADLPIEMEEPILTRFASSDFPIISLTLTSTTVAPVRLTELADQRIRRELTSLQGVASVDIVGGVERELTVEVQPEALRASGVSISQVVQTLQTENLAVPVGKLSGKLEDRTIRLRGRLSGPSEFEQLVVGRSGDRVVRLGDVAKVRDGQEEPLTAAFFNKTPAVGIDIKKALGYSTTDVSQRVLKRIAELQQDPQLKGTKLEIVRDSGARVDASVKDVQTSLFEGALLTILVVFIFLKSWRSTVITGLALPVSVIASFVAVLAFGFTLNVMSLLGLSLAIGILVDDAIVVRENIVRHMEMGKDHVRAAAEGTSEIGLAVAATTFSIVVVFVPIAFMGGVAQQWFAPFALTIACSVLVSLFVSFSLDPMLSAVWHDPEAAGQHSWLTKRLMFFDRAFQALTRRYKKIIAWALRHRFVMVVLALVTFFGALAIPATGAVGSSFFPIEDRSEFQISLECAPSSNLEYTQKKVLAAVDLALKRPEVMYAYSTIGGRSGADTAQIYVRLKPKKERKLHQDVVAQALRNDIRQLSGVTAYITTGFAGGFKQIQIQLIGPDTDILNGIAERVAKEVRQVPGAVDVGLSSKGQRAEVEIIPDRDLAGQLGISAAVLAQAVRPAFAGLESGHWIDPDGETRDVVVRLAPDWRQRPEDLEALPISLPQFGPQVARTIRLGEIAKVKRGFGPAQIEHLDGSRVVTVGANAEGVPLSAVVGAIEPRLAKMPMPDGYQRKQGGETQDQQEVFGRILIALGTAIMLMYFILVIQFGSFLEPIPIMASLPMSLIGVMLAMLVTGSTLNLMSMIGVIMLMGIVAKNAILLIDFAKQAEKNGLSREEAIVEAGAVRLRPIVMTSVAIVAGMIPVAIGSGEGGDFRAPLGRAVIGGVITSTVLTLLAIPTFYDIITHWRDAVIRRVRRKKPSPPPGTESH